MTGLILIIGGNIVLAIAGQGFDIWTTERNLSSPGGIEYNPIVKWSLKTFGSIYAIKLLYFVPIIFGFLFSTVGGMLAIEMTAFFGFMAGWLNVRHWNV